MAIIHAPTSQGATEATAAANVAALEQLPFGDRQDFEDAQRGFIAAPAAGTIADATGRVIWDLDSYAFEADDTAPPTVNPSLWRQAQLNRFAGLFKVTDRIYQVRNLDLSNMTIIEGDTGVIIIDPLISTECSRAGLDLYYQNRDLRPVVAVIYTHSHVDHFGGVRGVVAEDDVVSGKVRIYAPQGFLEHAVSENVFAGSAMNRRSQYMYGAFLPAGPQGQVDVGLGKARSNGTVSVIAPTHVIAQPLEKHTIDGVEMEFQLTPGTEAPAEMNFYFPQLRALCAAENVTHNMHNLLTLRGAEVRDPRAWSAYLTQTLALFGDRTDVLFASHHWPTWGADNVRTLLADQRDMYKYLHDQTLRLLNEGYTPMEIAERLAKLPPGLDRRWYCRGYYGSISHNVRAVYQRYLGFYDGNPANLNPLPPEEAGKRYVKAMGGADAVLTNAREAFERAEYRWAAQLVNHLVFAEPDNQAARELQADSLEQLGYQSENGTWRNNYLVGALELRNGVVKESGARSASAGTIRAMTIDLFFDYLGIRLNGERAGALPETVLNWQFTDLKESYALTLRNGALTYRRDFQDPTAVTTITLTKDALASVFAGETSPQQAIADGRIRVEGQPGALTGLFGLMDKFELMFNIVTP